VTTGDEAIRALREALRHSPDNLPLRLHLAQSLAALGRHEEAEAEFRTALSQSPESADAKLGLARVYYQSDKLSQAQVVVEDLVKSRRAPAAAHVLYARILLRRGDVADAVAQYKLALEIDASAADPELAQTLGVVPEEQAGDVYEGRVRSSWEEPGGESAAEVERPQTTFRDVGGMDALKEEIGLKIIYPLKHPEMYKAYGKSAGGGILMYGPPGCGKTHLARATAGEIAAGFIAVGISDVLDMWIGNSERNLRELFQQARYNKPCVLFFDEVDALGAKRSDMRASAGRQLINQFLAEMDGIERNNDGVLVLAATNAPWHVDSAFRRPGRFDRVLFVPPPDLEARASILRILCQEKPLDNVDFHAIARKTEDFSGADMKAVVDQTIEAKLREAMRTGRPLPITTADLLTAARSLKPTTREWFASARNYALYSNQGGLYDDVLKYLKL
jgi:SpoVK/Ycf46/Vps4 family AAA+-type ATPase